MNRHDKRVLWLDVEGTSHFLFTHELGMYISLECRYQYTSTSSDNIMGSQYRAMLEKIRKVRVCVDNSQNYMRIISSYIIVIFFVALCCLSLPIVFYV